MANKIEMFECEKCKKIHNSEEKADLCCSGKIEYKPVEIWDKYNTLTLDFSVSKYEDINKHERPYVIEVCDDSTSCSESIELNNEDLDKLSKEIERIKKHNILKGIVKKYG